MEICPFIWIDYMAKRSKLPVTKKKTPPSNYKRNRNSWLITRMFEMYNVLVKSDHYIILIRCSRPTNEHLIFIISFE